MNPKITAGFLVALIVVAGLVVGLDRFNVGQSQPKDEAQDQQLSIFTFDDQKVKTFTVRSGDKTVAFQKDDQGNWTVADSGKPANRVTLSGLLIRLSDLKGTKRVGEVTDDLKAFGLDSPKLDATVELDDGTKHVLQLGSKTPTSSGTYAKQPDSSDVFIVATQIGDDLGRLANSPEEPPTPTPRPSPTVTPAPAGTSTGTGTPVATPTP